MTKQKFNLCKYISDLFIIPIKYFEAIYAWILPKKSFKTYPSRVSKLQSYKNLMSVLNVNMEAYGKVHVSPKSIESVMKFLSFQQLFFKNTFDINKLVMLHPKYKKASWFSFRFAYNLKENVWHLSIMTLHIRKFDSGLPLWTRTEDQ